MLNIPSRRPDFNKIFPTRQDFETTYASVRKLVAEDSPSRPKWTSTFDAKQLSRAPLSPRDLSTLQLLAAGSKIVPSAHGRITQILFVIPNEFVQAEHAMQNLNDVLIDRHFRTLLGHLSQDKERRYIVVCKPFQVDVTRSWFEKKEIPATQVSFVKSPHFDLTMWAQDAYVALTLPKQTRPVLSEGISFPRNEDMTIADDIAAEGHIDVAQSRLYFEGGNILGGPCKTLIGYDYIWRNLTRFGMGNEEQVKTKFHELLGTEIISLGGEDSCSFDWLRRGMLTGYGNQPIFHLDMYVTRTGIIDETTNKEVVMLGRPKVAADVARQSRDCIVSPDAYDHFFDQTERQLKEACFEVKYLPLVLTHGDLGGKTLRPKFYYLSFNNVVIENYGKTRRVIMPTFRKDCGTFGGLDRTLRAELAAQSQQAWCELGFEVMLMDGLEDLAYGDGGIHCITKVLQRSHV